MNRHRKVSDLDPARGIIIGLLFSIPLWIGIYLFTTWIIN